MAWMEDSSEWSCWDTGPGTSLTMLGPAGSPATSGLGFIDININQTDLMQLQIGGTIEISVTDVMLVVINNNIDEVFILDQQVFHLKDFRYLKKILTNLLNLDHLLV